MCVKTSNFTGCEARSLLIFFRDCFTAGYSDTQ